MIGLALAGLLPVGAAGAAARARRPGRERPLAPLHRQPVPPRRRQHASECTAAPRSSSRACRRARAARAAATATPSLTRIVVNVLHLERKLRAGADAMPAQVRRRARGTARARQPRTEAPGRVAGRPPRRALRRDHQHRCARASGRRAIRSTCAGGVVAASAPCCSPRCARRVLWRQLGGRLDLLLQRWRADRGRPRAGWKARRSAVCPARADATLASAHDVRDSWRIMPPPPASPQSGHPATEPRLARRRIANARFLRTPRPRSTSTASATRIFSLAKLGAALRRWRACPTR